MSSARLRSKLIFCVFLLGLCACSDGKDGRGPVGPGMPDGGADAQPIDGDVIPAADGGGRDAARDDLDAGPDANPDASDDGGMLPPPPAAVGFDPPGGGFVAPMEITLTPIVEDEPVYYTLDGTLPTTASTQYVDPIALTETTLVRALSVDAAGVPTLVETLYLALDAEIAGFDSNLPVVVVHMMEGDLPQSSSHDWVSGMFALFEPSESRTKLDGAASFSSHVGIKVRGRSTRNQPKPSYTFELRDAVDEEAPRPLLGMPEESDWVLYAPFDFDKSLVRNAFVYQLARAMGRYAPRTRFCEVFVQSGAGLGLSQVSYRGVYVLTERLTRNPQRIPVSKLRETDVSGVNVSGGYIFKNDEPDGIEPNEQFTVGSGRKFVYDYPKPAVITTEQSAYLIGYIDSVERALKASDGIDPTTQTPYEDLIDVGSFIDAHIINVLAKNPDAFYLSEYFHKDRSGPLTAGPIWDFDLSMAAHDPFGERSVEPTHWGPNDLDSLFRGSFYDPIFHQEDFRDLYWARWDELLDAQDGLFNTEAFDATLDGYQTELSEAEARNRARWPAATTPGVDFGEEIGVIKTWLAARLTWIKGNLDVVPGL